MRGDSRTGLMVLLLSVAGVSGAHAADAAAGKVIADARCASCHVPKDWQGETSRSLEALIRDVVTGKVKHSKTKVELTDAQIADVAAYWLANNK